MNEASAPLLSVRDLSLDFESEGRRAQILRGVSLDVPSRSHVALVGESGCGKSVTMRAIMGLLASPPASVIGGEIFFDGVDLLKMRPREREALRGTAMSMVFQDPTSSLNPVFTIGDQMGTILNMPTSGLGAQGQNRPQHAHRRSAVPSPDGRSGADRGLLSDHVVGRDAPASADRDGAAVGARLLIADEPGTALDVTTQAQILKLMQDLVEARGWRC